MKKLFIILVFCISAFGVQAADMAIDDYTAMTVPTNDDLMLIENDPAGTPAYNKITWANIKASIAAGTAVTWGDGTGPVVWTFGVTGTDPTLTATSSLLKTNAILEAASFQATKASGVAGDVSMYEANSTDTDAAGFRGPTAMTTDTSYRGQFNTAGPSSANMVQAWAASGSGAGTPADPYIHALSWIDMDNYVPTTGASSISFGADPADSGAIRFSNNTALAWEPSTPGTDIFIALDSSDILQVGQNATDIYIGTSGTGNVRVTGDLTILGNDILIPNATAGARLSGGNGLLTIKGEGDGTDEDLTLNLNSANTATISTSTGVTDLSLSAINLATTGIIQGGIKIVSDANGMDAAAMTSAGMYGTMFIATGAGTWILPTGAVGMSGCLMSSGSAAELILDTTAGDTFRYKGAEGGDGKGVTNAAAEAAGDFICFLCVATNKWSSVGIGGSWAAQP